MEIVSKQESIFSVIQINGEIRTSEASSFGDALLNELQHTDHLVIDFGNVPYICSAGLRALLAAQQKVDEREGGELIIRNVNTEIMSVFKATGFINVFSIR